MHTRASLLLSLDGAAAAPTQSQEMKPVGDQPEIQSAERLLVMAYALIWIILFGVVILAYLRTRSLSSRIEVIEAALAKRSATPEPKAAPQKRPPTAAAEGGAAESEG